MKNLLRKSVRFGLVAVTLLSVMAPGLAHADRFHDAGWAKHERAAHDWRYHHPVAVPGVVYAPPAVVEAPPPPPGINLIIPFNIR